MYLYDANEGLTYNWMVVFQENGMLEQKILDTFTEKC